MSYYAKIVLQLVPCTPDEAERVVEVMRDFCGGTLDHMSRDDFRREARLALRAIRGFK